MNAALSVNYNFDKKNRNRHVRFVSFPVFVILDLRNFGSNFIAHFSSCRNMIVDKCLLITARREINPGPAV